MSTEFTDADAKAGACSYVLLMLLQRLEAKQAGLIEELLKGVEADKAAIEAQGTLTEPVRGIFNEAQRILQQAQGYPSG